MAPRFVRVYARAAPGPTISSTKAAAPRPPPAPRPKPTPSAPAAFPTRGYTDVIKMAKDNGGKIAHSSFADRCNDLHATLAEKLAERNTLRASVDPKELAKAKKLKGEAGRILSELTRRVAAWNQQLDKNTVDLHYTTPDMAVHILKTRLDAFFNTHTSSTFSIIHGAGKHSVNGICVVRAAVLHHLQANKHKYRFVEAYNGCTRVQLI